MLEILTALLVATLLAYFYARRKPKDYPPGINSALFDITYVYNLFVLISGTYFFSNAQSDKALVYNNFWRQLCNTFCCNVEHVISSKMHRMLWAVFLKITEEVEAVGYFFHCYHFTKMGWLHFGQIFLQTHLVTLFARRLLETDESFL
jgi:hypothetical protein